MSVGPKGVAVVGCGNIGLSRHIPAWLEQPSGYYLAAVADPDPRRREAGRIAGGLAEADAVAEAAELFDRPDIAVIDLCVPPNLRLPMVVGAARAGKHILTEKPFAVAPAIGESMVEACRVAGVTLGVVHNYLFFPEIARTLELIRSGAIGRVEVVILNYLGVQDNPGAAEYRPAWRHDPAESGGGVLMDLVHVVYLAEAVLGEPIEAVSAFVTARASGGVEDLAVCRFEGSEAVALGNVGWGVGPGGIEISGSRGRVSIRYEGGGTSPFAPFDRLELTDDSGTRVVQVPDGAGFLSPAIADFARALALHEAPAADGEHALHILEAALAAYESAATGSMVNLPLDRSDPVFLAGAVGIARVEASARSALIRHRIFGSGPPAIEAGGPQ